jgi:hypothetical protein
VSRGCRVYRTTNVTLADVTWTKVPAFDAEHYDNGGYHSLVTNPERITIPAGLGGTYLVTASCWFAQNANGFRLFQVTKNADAVNVDPVVYEDRSPYTPVGIGSVIAMSAGLWPLAAGDYVQLWAHQNSGGNLDLTANTKQGITLGVQYLGAP